MRICITAAASLAAFAALCPGPVRADSNSPPRDLGAEVRAVFAAKCAACHGPDVLKPKCRFGYVLDLKRVAANPEMVIPRQPAESDLWVLVERDEMPPEDSPHGGLTLAQKEVVRAWIAAGAPEVSPVAARSTTADLPEPPVPGTVEPSSIERFVRWLGKFHLLLLHFPIALILAAGVGEIWSIWKRSPVPLEPVRFCLWLAALAVLPTAMFGWLHAADGNGMDTPHLLTAHRWLGTTAAVCLITTAICAERDARRHLRCRLVRLLLITAFAVTVVTAHLGGLMVHGLGFFDY
jgi:hypothetical protein